MKYDFSIGALPDPRESIESKHAKLVQGLMKLGGRWGLPPGEYPAPKVDDKNLSAYFHLGKLLGKGIKGFVAYRFRGSLYDKPVCDDHIELEFNPERVEYGHLLNDVFPAYIKCFDPYSGYISDEEFTYIDCDRWQGVNGRYQVLRIYAVNYYQDRLCRSAFGISAKDVVNRLMGIVDRSEIINGGAYVVVKSTPMRLDDAKAIDEWLRPMLVP